MKLKANAGASLPEDGRAGDGSSILKLGECSKCHDLD